MALLLSLVAFAGLAGPAGAQLMDLSQPNRSFTAPNTKPVNVYISGVTIPGSNIPVAVWRRIAPGASVTAAELVAVNQVLSGHHQTILLSRTGAALGGRFDLAHDLSLNGISQLLIPKRLTALDNVALSPNLTLPTDLFNVGKVLLYSSDRHITAGSLAFNSITNLGTISSTLPAALQRSLHAIARLDMTLSIRDGVNGSYDTFINTGTIRSSGNLILIANGGMINSTRAADIGLAPAPPPSITAAGNITFKTGQMYNAGLVKSNNGNLYFAPQDQRGLFLVSNARSQGTLSANNGFISFYAPLTTPAYTVSLSVDDPYAKALYFDPGEGKTVLNMSYWGSMNNGPPPLLPISGPIPCMDSDDFIVDSGEDLE